MSITFGIASVVISNGEEVQFPSSGITVVVGPNNSGKSSLLREIESAARAGLQQSQNLMRVLRSAHFTQEGTVEQLTEYLEKASRRYTDVNGTKFFRALNANVPETHAPSWWASASNGLQGLSPFFCHLVDTQNRLSLANPPAQINLLNEPPSHPIHVLYENDEVEKLLSAFVKQSFGIEMTVNRGAGGSIPLHVGNRPEHTKENDRISRSYLEALSKVPMLANQGDGIKSFVGSLLATSVMKRFVTLLDEPEAFLHPPQARQLGKILAKEHSATQLIIATHSTDILRGLLDGNAPNLRVLRLTRDGANNQASTLLAEDIKTLWSDPILRFSNILDGLFHEGVVLCEADTDCRLYSAVMNALSDLDQNQKWPDLLFAASGGKDRMPVIVRALKKIRVPTKVVVDFDILADEAKLQLLFETLGGDWSMIRSDCSTVRKAIVQKSPPLKLNQVRDKVQEVFKLNEASADLSDSIRDQIRSTLKAASPWTAIKDLGLTALPAGDATQAAIRLIKNLRQQGLFVVPVGELEGFDRTEGNHGPKWLAKVMEKSLSTDPVLQEVRTFVRDLVLGCVLD